MSVIATLPTARLSPSEWPVHDPARTARDFRFWRHTRVVRARVMRHIHRASSLLSLRLAPRPKTTAYGVRMLPDWSDRSYAYCHYGTYGTYLADMIRAIECPYVFVDIGANHGVFSLIAASQPDCKRVIAVEPVAATYDKLVNNIAINDAQDRVTALEFAISDRPGVRMMRRRRMHSGVATMGDHILQGTPASICQPVNVRTISDLCRYIPEGLPLFIKIDVSGHETIVVEEILKAPCLRRVIGIFYSEDERWCDTGRLGRKMAETGFRPVRTFGLAGKRDVLAVPGPCPSDADGNVQCLTASDKDTLNPSARTFQK